jgi:hypothetical protein
MGTDRPTDHPTIHRSLLATKKKKNITSLYKIEKKYNGVKKTALFIMTTPLILALQIDWISEEKEEENEQKDELEEGLRKKKRNWKRRSKWRSLPNFRSIRPQMAEKKAFKVIWGPTDQRTDGPTNRWTDGRMDGWTDRQTDGRTDGQMDGRTNSLIEVLAGA